MSVELVSTALNVTRSRKTTTRALFLAAEQKLG
jgi:hypothetical protein